MVLQIKAGELMLMAALAASCRMMLMLLSLEPIIARPHLGAGKFFIEVIGCVSQGDNNSDDNGIKRGGCPYLLVSLDRGSGRGSIPARNRGRRRSLVAECSSGASNLSNLSNLLLSLLLLQDD